MPKKKEGRLNFRTRHDTIKPIGNVDKGGGEMALREIFNRDEENYDRYRPGYPAEVFETIRAYAGVGPGSRAVEIGPGTGQATGPVLDLGCQVTAVELGDRLAAFLRQKYPAERLCVVRGDFMDWQGEVPADLIYSATAFHWLPAPESYRKVFAALRPGGTAAIFRNHPCPGRPEDESNQANERVYRKYRPGEPGPVEFSEVDCEPTVRALREAGFERVESHLFHRVRRLKTAEYLGLIGTYSDHRAMPKEWRAAFEADMARELDAIGGEIRIYDTIDLYLARRPEI